MDHHQPSGSATRRSRVTDLVTITGIAVGGDGVGRLGDGRVVFIPRTAPGDQVRLRDNSLERHRNFARAEVGAIVRASPARVAPPCPHYVNDHCGGCQLQHVAYEGQLSAKRAIRSEEHTSELQSLAYLVCRLLLEKKKRAEPTI